MFWREEISSNLFMTELGIFFHFHSKLLNPLQLRSKESPAHSSRYQHQVCSGCNNTYVRWKSCPVATWLCMQTLTTSGMKESNFKLSLATGFLKTQGISLMTALCKLQKESTFNKHFPVIVKAQSLQHHFCSKQRWEFVSSAKAVRKAKGNFAFTLCPEICWDLQHQISFLAHI